MVYLAREFFPGAAQMVAGLKEKSVLTVSDADGFLLLGGHVQFYNQGSQIRLRLDLANLKRADLTASSQLLRVAEAR